MQKTKSQFISSNFLIRKIAEEQKGRRESSLKKPKTLKHNKVKPGKPETKDKGNQLLDEEKEAEAEVAMNIKQIKKCKKGIITPSHEEGKGEDKKKDDESENSICQLCFREQPIYFYQQEDVIKHIPT